ncbi:MAG: phosphoribosyltransferase [Deltaproteobacteria bacterium]|nr:phosphoribosyltransferase [Deltaproteobacteria bacterium]
MRYANREEAGRKLAKRLLAWAAVPDLVVLALPRGGVPVGFEVARELGAPLDVAVVRKLGVPGEEELAMGAVASGGALFLNPEVIGLLGIPAGTVDEVVRREQKEVERRERVYRDGRAPLEIEGRTVILVDDGLATGATMRAAIDSVKRRKPARLIVAVPVAAASTCEDIGALVDEIVCLATPEPFYAVGLWYEEFPQLDDEDVRELLRTVRQDAPVSRRGRG